MKSAPNSPRIRTALPVAASRPDDDEVRSRLELELGQLLVLQGDLAAGRARKQALLERLQPLRGEDDALVLRVMMSLATDLARSGELDDYRRALKTLFGIVVDAQ